MIFARMTPDGQLCLEANDGKRKVCVLLPKNGGSPIYSVEEEDIAGRKHWRISRRLALPLAEETSCDVVVETIVRAFAKQSPGGMVPHEPAPGP